MKKWLWSVVVAASSVSLSLASLPSHGAPVAPAQCQTLSFWAVKPSKNPHREKKTCDKKLDKSACEIRAAYERMKPVKDPSGRLAYSLDFLSDEEEAQVQPYIDALTSSPAIQEIDRMRIEARRLGGYSPAQICEPNLIYLGDEKLFGVGPVFVDSTRFMLGSKPYTSFISAEDASLFHVKLLSKDSLIRNGYFDIVVAHELAHALTQDLYGIDAFTSMAKKTVSRDGHMASAVTDQVIALMEGIAEGYEAYFGEKLHGRNHVYPTPTLDSILTQANAAADFFQERGYKGYIFGALPLVMKQFGSTLMNFADVTTEFLLAERQQTIRENHFITQGGMSNLAHRYDLVPGMISDPELDALAGWETEGYDALYSKEGVIAYLVYSVLKADLHEELFQVIAQKRPQDSHEFVVALLDHLKAHASPAKLAMILPAFKSTFTAAGRNAVRDYLRVAVAWRRAETLTPAFQQAERELSARLAKVTMPAQLPAPRELWLEFQTTSVIRAKLYGKMDRINIFTASPERVLSFVTSTQQPYFRKHPIVGNIQKALLSARETAPNLHELLRMLQSNPGFLQVGSMEEDMMRRTIEGLRKGAGCFRTHCLSLQ